MIPYHVSPQLLPLPSEPPLCSSSPVVPARWALGSTENKTSDYQQHKAVKTAGVCQGARNPLPATGGNEDAGSVAHQPDWQRASYLILSERCNGSVARGRASLVTFPASTGFASRKRCPAFYSTYMYMDLFEPSKAETGDTNPWWGAQLAQACQNNSATMHQSHSCCTAVQQGSHLWAYSSKLDSITPAEAPNFRSYQQPHWRVAAPHRENREGSGSSSAGCCLQETRLHKPGSSSCLIYVSLALYGAATRTRSPTWSELKITFCIKQTENSGGYF